MPRADAVRRGRIIAAARYAGIGLAAGVIGALIAYESGQPVPWLVGTACLIAVLLIGTVVTAVGSYDPPAGAPLGTAPRTPTDRESGGLLRVERAIKNGMLDVDRFNVRVRPWLVELAEARLVHRAGVDPSRDPEAARDLLGPSLWQLVQRPRTNAPSQREFGEWIARLEAMQ